jgi:hypothetical protein
MLCIYRTQQQHMPAVLYRTHALCFLSFLTKVNWNATFQSHERLRHQVEIFWRLTIGVGTILRVYSQVCGWFLTLHYCSVVAPSATALCQLHYCSVVAPSATALCQLHTSAYLYFCCLYTNVDWALSAVCCVSRCSRSCCCCDGSLETWKIVILTCAKFKSRTFSVLDLALSSVANVTTEINWTAYKDAVRTAQETLSVSVS